MVGEKAEWKVDETVGKTDNEKAVHLAWCLAGHWVAKSVGEMVGKSVGEMVTGKAERWVDWTDQHSVGRWASSLVGQLVGQ